MNDLLTLAAKWEDGNHGYHPLIYHLIDSGLTALALWEIGLSNGTKQQFCNWLGLNAEQSGQLLAYWTALHDLGKATPAFQARCPLSRPILKQKGYDFPPLLDIQVENHALLSAIVLKRQIQTLAIKPDRIARKLLYPIAGHHGTYPQQQKLFFLPISPNNLGDSRWHRLQDDLITEIAKLFSHPDSITVQWSNTVCNAFLTILTGFIITCDWIASDTNSFSYHESNLTPAEYYETIKPNTYKIVQRLGWQDWSPGSIAPIEFEALFTGYKANPIQQTVIKQISSLQDPFLMIIEAPTGSGKTEAALYVADRWITEHRLRGLYVAMPTQATSNQMYQRVTNYLGQRLHQTNLQPLLAHSNAMIQENDAEPQLSSVNDEDGKSEGQINALAWFTPRKRTLLAPFGVGTVDQTFFSVLHTRHFMLRLLGLSRKVVIFDEIHAYDVYMTKIFKQLLAWLRAIGSSVILLSATLPTQTRQELLQAFDPQAVDQTSSTKFPRLSINSGKQILCQTAGYLPSRSIAIEFISDETTTILETLQHKLSEGGCAAIICNTVGKAQKVFQALRQSGIYPEEELILLHSRFPYYKREELEKAVVSRFGKLPQETKTPRRGIVVSTQIIEQSLDLDFDLLISELPPIDLLIQRIGRLQRHTHQTYPPIRPTALQTPTCIIAMPSQSKTGLWNFGSSARVYEEYLLQRTALILRKQEQLCLPDQSDDIINAVYSEQDLPGTSDEQIKHLSSLRRKMQIEYENQEVQAQNRIIGNVDEEDVFSGRGIDICMDEQEDNLSMHPDLRAMTRYAQPSVQLICLVQDTSGNVYTLDGNQPCNLHDYPNRHTVRHALRSAIKVSNYWLVDYFRNQPCPTGWKKSAHLRHTFPLILKNRECLLTSSRATLKITLDDELGLIIEIEIPTGGSMTQSTHA